MLLITLSVIPDQVGDETKRDSFYFLIRATRICKNFIFHPLIKFLNFSLVKANEEHKKPIKIPPKKQSKIIKNNFASTSKGKGASEIVTF